MNTTTTPIFNSFEIQLKHKYLSDQTITMPPKPSSKPPQQNKSNSHPPDLDSYLLDGDLSDVDNPFRSPSPQPRAKEANTLGIDEEVEVKKRAHVPRVKLDETRLLSKAGIPTLRERAKHLKLKGKGHEWSDASKLLSLYQFWLDDLFPKAKFLDALGMVEKAGHKTTVQKARMEWIDEGKPRGTVDREWDDVDRAPEEVREPSRIAPVFERAKIGREDRPRTPALDGMDLFGDDDIYGATPRGKTVGAGGEPDEDDLDALMAEAEAGPSMSRPVNSIFGGSAGGKPASSLFGGGPKATQPASRSAAADEPDEDDLDALMAEAEETRPSTTRPAVSSIFGDGKPKATASSGVDDLADDDLDALMAEAETEVVKPKPSTKADEPKKGEADSFADDEDAMAEMDGLW